MTKIKNFRIACRPREMARWLKKTRGQETTPELEVSLEQFVKEGKHCIEPAAVYTTLPRPIAEKTTELIFPDKVIAVSVIAVSIGGALGKERLAAASGDPLREPLWAALEQEAIAQAFQFAIRLVQDQAKEEDCELSSPEFSQKSDVASSLATLVGVQRIGVALDASSSDLPAYVRVAWLFWTPVGKRPSSAKATAGKPASAEKVAA